MRKLLILAAVAAALLPRQVFAIAASQAWVAQYVSNYVAQTEAAVKAGVTTAASNNCTYITANAGTTNEVRLVIEDATDAALCATNCTGAAVAQGITNGLYFVWNGAGSYVNPAGTIAATRTNFVFRGVSSVRTNGVDRFAGWFDAYGAMIQPSVSLSITNATQEVNQ